MTSLTLLTQLTVSASLVTFLACFSSVIVLAGTSFMRSLTGGVLLHPGFVRSNRSRSELENRPDSFNVGALEMLDTLLALALPVGSTKDNRYTCPMGIGPVL